MENTKKINILSRILERAKKGWERLGEPDIIDEKDLSLDASMAKELKEIEQVQEKVHEQRSVVQRARVNEKEAQVSAKKGKAKGTIAPKTLEAR